MKRAPRNVTDAGRGVPQGSMPRPPIRWERGVLAGWMALVVAAPLVPSELAAETGNGVVFVLLWMLLALGWLLAHRLMRRTTFRWQTPDTLVVALVLWQTASGLWMARQGHPRPVINAIWQTWSLAAVYLLARQCVHTQRDARAVCAVVMALTAALAAYGLYQHFVIYPQSRAAFDRDPVKMLKEAGANPDPASPEARQFKDRLESTEPIATFALTNSLAGLLAPWSVFLVAVAWQQLQRRRGLSLLGMAIAGGAMGFCLVLTKSRTAYVATLIGVMGVAICRWSARHSDLRASARTWRLGFALLCILGVFVLAIVLAIASGGIDMQVLSEAPKSLRYRFEYWQATLAMIRDHPWWGCGAGNFQDFYALYKLPQASEMVAEPHNFLFEIWAASGTPALALFLTLLVTVLWQALLPREPAPAERGGDEYAADPPVFPVYFGAVAGLGIGWLVGTIVGIPPDALVLLSALTIGTLSVMSLQRWVVDGELGPRLLLVVAITLAIHWLACGGISTPGVAGTWWLVLGLLLNGTATRQGHTARPGWWWVAIATQLMVLVACYVTLYHPVLDARACIDRGRQLPDAPNAERAFREAARIDPFWSQPWVELANVQLARILATGTESETLNYRSSVQAALERDRRSFDLRRMVADGYISIARRTGQSQYLERAASLYVQAVALYPHSAFLRARLAWCYDQLGHSAEARAEAGEALRLDALNPHEEQRLANRALFEGQPPGSPLGESAELFVRGLRNGGTGRR